MSISCFFTAYAADRENSDSLLFEMARAVFTIPDDVLFFFLDQEGYHCIGEDYLSDEALEVPFRKEFLAEINKMEKVRRVLICYENEQLNAEIMKRDISYFIQVFDSFDIYLFFAGKETDESSSSGKSKD